MKNRIDIGKYEFNLMTAALNKRGKIISYGQNSYIKSHPKMQEYNLHSNRKCIFLHSEIDALIKCREKPYMLIVARIGKKGDIRIARPCPICQEAIRRSGVEKVYFTDNNGELVLFENNETIE